MKKTKRSLPKHISGPTKLFISFVIGVVAYCLLLLSRLELENRIILAWDCFCLSLLVFSWVLFFSTNEEQLCDVVEAQDDGLQAIFGIVLVAICFSLFGTLLLLTGKTEPALNKIVQALISLSPVILSWSLLHTIFTVRYAHLYNDHNKLNTGTDTGGVQFPSKGKPDFVDFAYFSFVIGMTFQVSDVQINSRVIRRFVLMHSLISFVFNTTIVALTINAIAGLRS